MVHGGESHTWPPRSKWRGPASSIAHPVRRSIGTSAPSLSLPQRPHCHHTHDIHPGVGLGLRDAHAATGAGQVPAISLAESLGNISDESKRRWCRKPVGDWDPAVKDLSFQQMDTDYYTQVRGTLPCPLCGDQTRDGGAAPGPEAGHGGVCEEAGS